MVVTIGRIVAYAKCANCGGGIHQSHFGVGDQKWRHDDGDEHCPTAPVAAPLPGSIEPNPCICGASISVQCAVHGLGASNG